MVQVSNKPAFLAGIKDPCSGITCAANLKCPAGFSSTEVAGHCCPYCVNPNIKIEAAVTGATGTNGGKASTFCPKVWCFPTMCTKALSNPTTTTVLAALLVQRVENTVCSMAVTCAGGWWQATNE